MWRLKVILILSTMLLVVALAQTDPTSSTEDYEDFPDEVTIRMFPHLFSRGKSGKESASESNPIQRYWQNFVRNIPPLRWNMTNSLGNLFNAGGQNIMETAISNNYDINRNRKRKSSNARKPVVKKNNPRKRYHSRGNDYAYSYPASHNPYGHIQLQALGLDQQNVMHFLDPRSGQYYALNMVTSPNQYGQLDYYGAQRFGYDNEDDIEDDSYYGEDNYSHEVQTPHRNYAYEEQEDSGEGEDSDDHSLSPHAEYEQHHSGYNEYEHYAEESVESGEEYGDIQVADNWGYFDDDTNTERKLKLSLRPIRLRTKDENDSNSKGGIKSSIIKLQKSMLKPETEKDVMLLLTNSHKRNQKTPKPPSSRPSEGEKKSTSMKRIKPSKKSPDDEEMESVRNVLGSYMADDVFNRQRQRSPTKAVKQRFVERPRGNVPNFSYPRFW